MSRIMLQAALLSSTLGLIACSEAPGPTTPPDAVGTPVSTARVVEAACGQCLFELPGEGCDLAVRIDGKAYYVDGTNIDDHGDAHAADGFCSVVRKARVTGAVVDDRFTVEAFELLPADEGS